MDRIALILTNSDFKRYLKANRMNYLIWAGFLFGVLVIYHFLSDGDFSFLLVGVKARPLMK